MSLKEKLNSEFKEAFKSKNILKTDVLRLLNSAIKNREIELRAKGEDKELTDEQIMELITKESKKRKDAIIMFEKGGRIELKEKEEQELEIIQGYLPKQLSKKETEKSIDDILKGKDISDFGSVMGMVMGVLKGKADAKVISEIIRKKIGEN
jgi:uncharacterized protein